jgi:hypothetical protein
MKRRTHRSDKGPKLYPLAKGARSRLKDIETYRRAHAKGRPITPAEERLIQAAIKHLEPHEVMSTDATWSWACADEELSRAAAAVLRERGKK